MAKYKRLTFAAPTLHDLSSNIGIISIWIIAAFAMIVSSEWDQKNIAVKQGEDVIIKCTLRNIDFFDVVRIDKRDNKQASVAIADNADIKKPFSMLPRYKVYYEHKDKTVVVTLKYHGIRGEDAGEIGCYKLSDDADIKVSLVILSVLTPVKSVNLGAMLPGNQDRPIDASGVSFVENEERGIYCVAVIDGNLTPPEVKIRIDGLDETKLFTATEQSQVLDSEDGLGIFRSEMRLSYVTPKPDARFDGKTLTCVASQKGFPDLTKSANISVQYSPIITCPNYDFFKNVGESFSVMCEVKGNPDEIATEWEIAHTTGTNHPHNASFSKKVEQGHATMEIKNVKSSDFTEYKLRATNRVGGNEVTLYLRQTGTKIPERPHPGKPGESHKSGSSRSSMRMVVLSASATFIIFVIFGIMHSI